MEKAAGLAIKGCWDAQSKALELDMRGGRSLSARCFLAPVRQLAEQRSRLKQCKVR